MDYLTVKETSELKGCSVRYINRLIKNGKMQAEIRFDDTIKQNCYFIPISALPEDLQAKYYAKLKKDVGLAPELKDNKTALKQSSKSVKKAFDEYSQAEREEMAE